MKVPGLLLLAACAAPRAGQPLRIAATHTQSMAGVKVGAAEESMTCNREMITGSHLLQWYCRFEVDGPQYQLGVPVVLELRGK